MRATLAPDARKKKPVDSAASMKLPFLADLNPNNATFVILRNSGVHTGTNAKVKEEQSNVDARLTFGFEQA